MNLTKFLTLSFALSNLAFALNFDNAKDINEALNLKSITLYNSGVNYYEYEGRLENDSLIKMSFNPTQISDILKSLTIVDPNAKKISFNYDIPSESLDDINQNITLSLADFLLSKKGYFIEINSNVKGRILTINKNKFDPNSSSLEDSISVFNEGEITTIKFSDIKSFKFVDSKLNEELEKTLKMAESSSYYKNIYLDIKSDKIRDVKLAYVMQAPIYKISYRAYLDKKEALFQAWVFINNSNNFDWRDVNISLMSSEPFSYTNDLYSPTYKYRQNIENQPYYRQVKASPIMEKSSYNEDLAVNKELFLADVKESKSDQFYFTLPGKVTILKNQSLALPLVSANLPMQKFSFLSNIKANGIETKATLNIEIENNTNLRLPSGIITMYEDGNYIGDSIMKSFLLGDKTNLSFGEDENLVASRDDKNFEESISIGMKNGILKEEKKSIITSNYTIKNKSQKEKDVVLKHPKFKNQELSADIKPYEDRQNYSSYKLKLKPNEEQNFKIDAINFKSTSYKLINLDNNQFSYYLSNSQISPNIKKVFEDLAEKRNFLDTRYKVLSNLQSQKDELFKSQQRARENLKAIGNSSENSKKFLDQILEYEDEISEINNKIAKTKHDIEILFKELQKFINSIEI